jgi:hypothetical protein
MYVSGDPKSGDDLNVQIRVDNGVEPDAWREYGGVGRSRPVAFAAVALILPLTAAQGGCTVLPERGVGRSGVTVICVQAEASSAWPVQRAVSAWNSGCGGCGSVTGGVLSARPASVSLKPILVG